MKQLFMILPIFFGATLVSAADISDCAKAVFDKQLAYSSSALASPQLVSTAVDTNTIVVREGAQLSGPVITTSKGSIILDLTGEKVKCSEAQFGNLASYLSSSVEMFAHNLTASSSRRDLNKARAVLLACSNHREFAVATSKIRRVISSLEIRTAPGSTNTVE